MTNTRIVTSTYRYKRPPRKRKAVPLEGPAIVRKGAAPQQASAPSRRRQPTMTASRRSSPRGGRGRDHRRRARHDAGGAPAARRCRRRAVPRDRAPGHRQGLITAAGPSPLSPSPRNPSARCRSSSTGTADGSAARRRGRRRPGLAGRHRADGGTTCTTPARGHSGRAVWCAASAVRGGRRASARSGLVRGRNHPAARHADPRHHRADASRRLRR